MSRARFLLVSAAAALVLASAATARPSPPATAGPSPAAAASPSQAAAASASRTATVLTVGGPATARPIPSGFLGLSLEYSAIAPYAGTDPNAVDPVLVQLVRNLAPGQSPDLRIGGDTTDWTWWPVPGAPTPAGVDETLTPGWIATTRALAAATRARLTLGINFEADSATVAATEADELISGLGRSSIEALELGNEPELYATFTWGGAGRTGRPHGYDFAVFSRDFARIARALPNMPLAGPASGGPRWFKDVGRFLADHRQVAMTTLHRYPLQLCYVHRDQPNYPTIPNLLSSRSSRGLANSVAAAVRASHARHVPLRIDEMNTIGCGTDRAVGESFASALWALDAVFNMARVGVDGVNISSFPGATWELFSFSQSDGTWLGQVMPEYYGLDMFAQAAPVGSRLLTVSPTGAGHVRAWATRATDHTVRVVLINEGSGARVFRVRLPAETSGSSGNAGTSGTGGTAGTSRTGGTSGTGGTAGTSGTRTQDGTVEYLSAPSIGARSGVTLGGQSFGSSTTTGLLAGAPKTTVAAPSHGEYTVRVPAASAVMLTVPPPT